MLIVWYNISGRSSNNSTIFVELNIILFFNFIYLLLAKNWGKLGTVDFHRVLLRAMPHQPNRTPYTETAGVKS